MPKGLKRSVGAGAENRPEDVATIQYLLNCTPKQAGGPVRELVVDGVAGPLTVAAIERFDEDGTIDPRGAALLRLRAFDPFPNQPMRFPAQDSGAAKAATARDLAAQAVVQGISEAIAGALERATGKPAAAVSRAVVAGVEAARGVLERHAANTEDTVRAAMEAALRTAEAEARMQGLRVPLGGLDFPCGPGAPGGAFGLGELCRKIAERARRAEGQAPAELRLKKCSGLKRAGGGVDAKPRLTAFVREVLLPAGPDRVPKLNRSATRFALLHRSSKIQGWGLFADEDIPARRRVIEYTGKRINGREVARRSVRPHFYHFWLNDRWALDGAIGGSGAEFINHSCDPNLAARVARGRIWLVSLRAIAKGEELTFDYHTAGAQMLPCRCGAKACRGYLNPIMMDE